MNWQKRSSVRARNRLRWVVCEAIVAIILAGLLLTACKSSHQETFTVGILNPVEALTPVIEAFQTSMAAYGYKAGDNVTYLNPGIVSQGELDAVAQNFVESQVDLVFSVTSPATLAAKRAAATTDVCVVFAVVLNPVEAGIVCSSRQPGCDITGIESSQGEGVKLQWLTRIVPNVARVYIPYSPNSYPALTALEQVKQIAPKLDLTLVPVQTHNAGEVEAAIEHIPETVDAIFLLTDSLNASHRKDWAEAALTHQLPLAVPPGGEPTETGALFTYGFNLVAVGKQAARLTDQVFSGVQPTNLPIETPELFLSINLKTAQAIGLDIPDEILRQAEVIIR